MKILLHLDELDVFILMNKNGHLDEKNVEK